MYQETWIKEGQGFTSRISGRLLTHCFVMMFVGFTGGFVWLIHLADNVFHILPLPRMEVIVPDQGELLRNTHTGPIMNAMYVMAIVVMSPRLNFSVVQAKWVYYSAIVLLWGNTIGYTTAVFAPERGLQPIGDWPNLISYATFYSAVVGATITTGICLTNAIRASQFGRRRQDESLS